jgi:hypothetical protein
MLLLNNILTLKINHLLSIINKKMMEYFLELCQLMLIVINQIKVINKLIYKKECYN